MPDAVFLPISAVLLHICSFRHPLSLLLLPLQIHSRWHRIPLLPLRLFLRISEFYTFLRHSFHRGSVLFRQGTESGFLLSFLPTSAPVLLSSALLFPLPAEFPLTRRAAGRCWSDARFPRFRPESVSQPELHPGLRFRPENHSFRLPCSIRLFRSGRIPAGQLVSPGAVSRILPAAAALFFQKPPDVSALFSVFRTGRRRKPVPPLFRRRSRCLLLLRLL